MRLYRVEYSAPLGADDSYSGEIIVDARNKEHAADIAVNVRAKDGEAITILDIVPINYIRPVRVTV